MKPKTSIQKRVVALSARLRPATEKQMSWAYEHCFDKEVARSKNTLFCLECGHSWSDSCVMISAIIDATCPQCGLDLKIKEVKGSRYNLDREYYSIITRKAGFQVVRMFYVTKQVKKGQPVHHNMTEVMQHWIECTGNVETLSLPVMGLSHYYDQWNLCGELEIRQHSYREGLRYNLKPYKIYPGRSIMPIIKRNGFKGHFYDFAPHVLFSLILRDNYAETLLKAGQIEFLRYYSQHPHELKNTYWSILKICIRNGYIIKDSTTFRDYIMLLQHFGKDTHNAKYICPDNLKREHDRLVKKKRDRDNKKRIQELRKQIEADQLDYEKEKSRFFNLQLQDGELTIEPLRTVDQFLKEGDEMKHCLFTNEYYKKPDSLILSARLDNKPVETVEVSLRQLAVVQARGRSNVATPFHERILNLVNSNIHKIAALA